MERTLCESVRRPGFEFGVSTDSLLCFVQLLKYCMSLSYTGLFLLADFALEGERFPASWYI